MNALARVAIARQLVALQRDLATFQVWIAEVLAEVAGAETAPVERSGEAIVAPLTAATDASSSPATQPVAAVPTADEEVRSTLPQTRYLAVYVGGERQDLAPAASRAEDVGGSPPAPKHRPIKTGPRPTRQRPSPKRDAIVALRLEGVTDTKTIAQRVGSTVGAVRTVLVEARARGDVPLGEGLAAETGSPPRPASTDQAVAVAPAAAPVVKPAPAAPEITLPADRVMAFTMTGLTVVGPRGRFGTSWLLYKTLQRLADGGLYDVETLRKVGGWRQVEDLHEQVRQAQPRLAAIGVELMRANKVMYRARRLEA